MTRAPRAVLGAIVMLVVAGTVAPSAAQDAPAPGDAAPGDAAASLPSVASGARPGPDVLYAPAPDAPQLENRDPRFDAEPLLVSGAEAYVDGEYLYQDHLYDDYGADTDASGGGPLAASAGDLTYPTDRDRFAGNAADLVELRIAVDDDLVAYRITLNSLLDPTVPIVALAFDTDLDPATGTDELPGDPGAPFPGTDEVLTIRGEGAEHTSFGADPATTTTLEVDTDLEANQLTVVVPRSVSDPAGSWRTTVVAGLHDPATGGWLRPGLTATATEPGGASPLVPAPSGIFNVGFRFDEPVLGANTPPDTAQAEALAAGEPTDFAHEIDFDALDAGIERTTVPATGTQVRIFPSRLDLGEGRDLDTFPAYLGPLQPYSLYVPSTYDPDEPAGLTLDLHSLGQEHWQYNGSEGVRQLGEQRGDLVMTPLSRGPDGWYQHEAEFDVFEVWNDVARHFSLDPDRVALSGYSMGGYGTYRLGGLWPDLFGRAFSVVGPPGEGVWLPPAPPSGGIETLSNLWLENVRNIPFLNVVAGQDQLVPIVGPRAQNLGAPELGIRGFDQLGYRFRFVTYSPAEHFTLAILGYDIPFAPEFLGRSEVDRDPRRVTFARVPASDDGELGLVHDHAYWVSEVALADPAGGGAPVGKGVVDAFSHADGLGDPPSSPGADAGTEPLPYVEINRTWGEAPPIPAENRLTLSLTNVGAARLDVARARLDPAAELTIPTTADADGTVRLDGAFPAGSAVLVDGSPVPGAVVDGSGVTIPVTAGTRTYVITTVPPGGDPPTTTTTQPPTTTAPPPDRTTTTAAPPSGETTTTTTTPSGPATPTPPSGGPTTTAPPPEGSTPPAGEPTTTTTPAEPTTAGPPSPGPGTTAPDGADTAPGGSGTGPSEGPTTTSPDGSPTAPDGSDPAPDGTTAIAPPEELGTAPSEGGTTTASDGSATAPSEGPLTEPPPGGTATDPSGGSPPPAPPGEPVPVPPDASATTAAPSREATPDGELPRTGGDPSPGVAAALAAIALGLAALVAARRRWHPA